MRRRIRQPRSALLAAIVLLLAGAAPATAAAWVDATPPANAADGPSGAVVAVDPAGDAIAAWTDDDGAGTQSLLAAWRPAGGAWSAPQSLASRRGVDAPAVALDASGNATVVWIDSGDGAAFAAHAVRRDAASGSWGAPHDFAPAGAVDPQTQVRADASGNVVAAWLEHDPSTSVAFVRAAVWSGGGWSAPSTLSDPSDAWVADGPPQIAPDASGGALVAWTAQRLGAPFDFTIQTATQLGGGSWSGPATLLPDVGETVSPLRLVDAGGGDVAATWFQGSSLAGGYRQNGAWSVDPLSADVAPACVPLQALGADAGGGATVVWKAASTSGLEAMRLTTGGPVSDGTPFASATESAADAAVDRGTVVLVAHDAASGTDSVLATQRTDGGWSAPALLGAGGAGALLADPQLAGNAAGDRLAGWIVTDPLGAKTLAAAFQAGTHASAGGAAPPPAGAPAAPAASVTSPPPPAAGGSGGGTLLAPVIGGARNGVLVLGRRTRTLKLTVRNPNASALRGPATLARPRAGRQPALTLATRRGLVLPARRRTTVTLRLSDRALRALGRAPGHRLRVTLTLRLRAADGRRVGARAALTLDAAPHFGARRAAPSARTSC
jgi:hypothetical protein